MQGSFETSTDFSKELNRASVPELEKQNAETAGVIDDMILVMGLSSLLIGGIGIVNTMLVVVSRRTLEIAVLKTLGLKGYRVTFLFLVEALLMGLIGSLIGIVIGVILSYLVRGVGEEAFSLSLEWRLYPEAMLSGLFLGDRDDGVVRLSADADRGAGAARDCAASERGANARRRADSNAADDHRHDRDSGAAGQRDCGECDHVWPGGI